MDITAALVQYLPSCMLPKLKFLVTVLGGAASVVVATYPGADHRYVIASAVCTAIGTYLTPNVPPVTLTSVAGESQENSPETDTILKNQIMGLTPAADKPEGALEAPVAEPVTQAAPAPVEAPEQAAPKVTEVGV